MIRRIRRAVGSFAKAAMFELYDDGHVSLFEQLVACIISVRTRDEISIVTARRLFRHARTAREMAALTIARIGELIAASTFHEAKAGQIHAVARRALEEFNGELPCDRETLLSFHGVGPKCANLALGIACGQKLISVDIHVHRVTNRWGYVSAATPEQTMAALGERLPEEYRVEINRLLVPFGKHICTGTLPKCSACPVLEMCGQVGVEKHR
ncbi:MAG: endonuclease III [Bacteroidetes bacterium]|nr:endonuclease III [Bacteroidota bacterium]